jgi:hypothetical protein
MMMMMMMMINGFDDVNHIINIIIMTVLGIIITNK